MKRFPLILTLLVILAVFVAIPSAYWIYAHRTAQAAEASLDADAVEAVNQISGGLLQTVAGGDLDPGIPGATKYALVLAVVTGGAGGYCLWKAAQPTS